jgi:hypothetical protein
LRGDKKKAMNLIRDDDVMVMGSRSDAEAKKCIFIRWLIIVIAIRELGPGSKLSDRIKFRDSPIKS